MKAKRAKAALKALPASIRVSNIDWTIEMMTVDDTGNWGTLDGINEAILLDETMSSPHRVVETFVHEVMHALYARSSLKDGDDEERVITGLAKGFTCVCRDNPWFAKWIATYSS